MYVSMYVWIVLKVKVKFVCLFFFFFNKKKINDKKNKVKLMNKKISKEQRIKLFCCLLALIL